MLSGFSINNAFAGPQTHVVEVPAGTSVPGCEETNSCYSPADITINVGDTVEWPNVDTAAHTVTSGSPSEGPTQIFDSSLLMADATYAFTFEEAGEYDYFCMVHPWMVGSVSVGSSFSTTSPYSIPRGTDITIAVGSGAPGCEQNNSCYSPYKFITLVGKEIDWFNADSAAHTVTAGTPGDGPTGEFDSGLFMGGGSFSVSTNTVGEIPYFCMVHPWMEGLIVVKELDPTPYPDPYPAPTPKPTPPPAPKPTISIYTDTSQYAPSDMVTVKVSTSQSSIVAISVIDSNGDGMISRSVSTDSRGTGSFQFKLPDSAQNGSYRIDASATVSGTKVSDSATFTVKSTSARVNITSLQPTDQQGNSVSSFTKGKLGFVKVILNSDSSTNSLVTINLFDSELTSLGIGSFKTTLSPGQSEMTLSFFVPNDASFGNGDIYANVFTDWPSQGGVPLTGESATQVKIQ